MLVAYLFGRSWLVGLIRGFAGLTSFAYQLCVNAQFALSAIHAC